MEYDMAKRIQQRAVINGKTKWLSGETQQDIFDAYLQCVIDAGIVVLPSSRQSIIRLPAENLFETRAWKWYNLYKVGKVRAKTLANYEGYLKKHLLPYFGQCDISAITIDNVQEFMNSKAAYSKKTIEELLLTLGMILNAAKEDGLISINPAKSKRLRNPSSKKSVREALTSAEADDMWLCF